MKRASIHGECALIRVRRLWYCAPCCVLSKQDRTLVTEPVNDTKLASLSVTQESGGERTKVLREREGL